MAITLQAEFSLFPDNTVLGPTFTLAAYRFTDIGAPPSFVNVSGAVKGLQFAIAGVRVRLPAVIDRVTIRAAAFAGPFNIIGKDSAGATLITRVVPGDNAPHTITLIRPGLARVDFIGGNNEGVIISMSVKVC
jgi:hypothetical protein